MVGVTLTSTARPTPKAWQLCCHVWSKPVVTASNRGCCASALCVLTRPLLLLLPLHCCCPAAVLLLSRPAGNVLLCPQSCLNLGSWATLFKLKSACMCEQDKLFLLQKHSMAVATDAGVALGGLILIYFGSCCMHTYLISEHVRAGYDYKRVSGVFRGLGFGC